MTPSPPRHCEKCGKRLVRRRRQTGNLEPIQHFAARRFCNVECSGVRTKGAKPTLTDEQVRTIMQARKQGATLAHLSVLYGVARNTIISACRRADNTATLADFVVVR